MNPPNKNLVQVIVLVTCGLAGGGTYLYLTRSHDSQSRPASVVQPAPATLPVRQLPPPAHPAAPTEVLARLTQAASNASFRAAPAPVVPQSIAQQMDEAATKGDLETVSNLFAAHPELIDARNTWGSTPLTDASYNGRDAVVAWLLAHGADVNTQNNTLWTPLIHAARRGHVGAVRLLLANHADASLQTNLGYTALDIARQYHWTEVEALLASQNVQTNEIHHELTPPR